MSKSITKILSCKPKWETLAGDTAFANCTSVSQFRFFSHSFQIFLVASQRVRHTEGEDFQDGDGGDSKTDRMFQALPLQGVEFR